MLILLGIFSSTIKNNVLFGKEYNHKLFQRVINVTALDTVGWSEYYIQTLLCHSLLYRILFNCLMVQTLLLVIKVLCYLEWETTSFEKWLSIYFVGSKSKSEYGKSIVSWCWYLFVRWSTFCCWCQSVKTSFW